MTEKKGKRIAAVECDVCGYQEEQEYSRKRRKFGTCPTCDTGDLIYMEDVEA